MQMIHNVTYFSHLYRLCNVVSDEKSVNFATKQADAYGNNPLAPLTLNSGNIRKALKKNRKISPHKIDKISKCYESITSKI